MIDQKLKIFNVNVENFERTVRDRCDKGKDALKISVAEEIKSWAEKLENIKIENGKYNYNLINQCKELKSECDEFPRIRASLDKKLEEFKNVHDHTNSNFEEIAKEFELFQVKFNELSEFIKVI